MPISTNASAFTEDSHDKSYERIAKAVFYTRDFTGMFRLLQELNMGYNKAAGFLELGEQALAAHDLEAAILCAHEAVRCNDNWADSCQQMYFVRSAKLLARLGDIERALELLGKIKRTLDRHEVICEIAVACEQKREPARAEALLQDVPPAVVPFKRLALARLEQGNQPGAREIAERMVSMGRNLRDGGEHFSEWRSYVEGAVEIMVRLHDMKRAIELNREFTDIVRTEPLTYSLARVQGYMRTAEAVDWEDFFWRRTSRRFNEEYSHSAL